ncbi:MAG: toll/interleukin-1 receptor domain-containing protein [Gallionella sp.]
MKIFLSHSSSDKTLVKRIYDELGAALCHYDSATFDPTGSIPSEIYSALNESTHFILFASPSAMSSGWVKGELARAFDNWMRNGNRRAMVFLIGGTAISDIPEWLRIYVIREPPTYRHILCRIQSEIDKERRDHSTPPFFRPTELQRLESKLIVESSQMPGAVLVHGPDGSGRKRLLNELYSRQFPGVATRKLLIATSAYGGARELYRDLVGLTTIATPSDFSQIFEQFDALSDESKIEELRRKIEECTEGNQCVMVEGDRSLLTEEGSLPDWLINLSVSLSGKDYPRLALTTFRKPTHVPIIAIDKLTIQEVPELDRAQSNILFNWWLRTQNSPYAESLKELVFEACSGNPKQLELGAKLLVAQGKASIAKIRPHLIRSLEGLSRQFLEGLSSDELSATTLAFVANTGYVTRSDLTQYLIDAQLANLEHANEVISICMEFGFLIEDEVCLRMPAYLVRGARAIGSTGKVESNLAVLWKLQASRAASMKVDELTSISVLNEHCLAALRSGTNVGTLFESIILPSQCLQVARVSYERGSYSDTLRLCKRAYISRAALSHDGIIETLRYMGMAAARLGDRPSFQEASDYFGELNGSKKAERIQHFIHGFKARLDGNYDTALYELNHAHRIRGDNDLHILRELAFINLGIDEVATARGYINTALSRASTNHYILELAVRAELIGNAATVAKRSDQIESLLDRLKTFDTSPDKIYWLQAMCEYQLALNHPDQAEATFASSPLNKSTSPAIDLLKAKIQMKKGAYSQSTKLLAHVHAVINNQNIGQRKSLLPIVCRWLIESACADSVADAVVWFEKLQKQLPKRLAAISAKQILDQAAYTHIRISDTHVKMLQSIVKP